MLDSGQEDLIVAESELSRNLTSHVVLNASEDVVFCQVTVVYPATV